MWNLGSWMSSKALHTWVMEKSFPDTNLRLYILYSIICVPLFRKLINYKPTNNPIASLICEIKSNYLMIDQPTTQPIGILVLVILLIWYFHRAYYFNTGLMSLQECVNYWGQQNVHLTALWQLWNSEGYTCICDGVCLFIYSAGSTTVPDRC